MHLLKGFIYGILSIQEKVLRKRLSKTLSAQNKSKRKRSYDNGCILDLSSLADDEKTRYEEELTNILKSCDYEPEKFLKYIESQGTGVYYIKDADKLLNLVNENEGFIYPASGLKAVYLSLAVFKKPKFKTREMFILSQGNINKYYFIYHVYNWYAYKNNLSGMDKESQELLRKYLYTDADTKELQLDEIYKLKDAIKQDKSAIEFVVKLCRNYEGAKRALEKLKNDDGAKL